MHACVQTFEFGQDVAGPYRPKSRVSPSMSISILKKEWVKNGTALRKCKVLCEPLWPSGKAFDC